MVIELFQKYASYCLFVAYFGWMFQIIIFLKSKFFSNKSRIYSHNVSAENFMVIILVSIMLWIFTKWFSLWFLWQLQTFSLHIWLWKQIAEVSTSILRIRIEYVYYFKLYFFVFSIFPSHGSISRRTLYLNFK